MPDETAARTVLVVDDDPYIRSLLRECLELEGFDVRTAPDGYAGLEIVAAEHLDCVILDLMMPGIDGHSVLTEIRAGAHSSLPVIMLTAATDDDQTWLAWSGGVNYFLPKPFDVDHLLQYVDYLCGSTANASAPVAATSAP